MENSGFNHEKIDNNNPRETASSIGAIHDDPQGRQIISRSIKNNSLSGKDRLVKRGNNDMRNEKMWGGVKHYFKDIDKFKEARKLDDGLTCIEIGSTFIDIYATLRKGAPLYVYFNGAKIRKGSIRVPIFSGGGVHPSDECSRLSISDPALHLSKGMTLGWYAGSTGFATQRVVIPAILDKVIALSNPSKIVFVGGSGGGFASLYFSRKYKGSIAVVCNPQTNILRYHSTHVLRFLKVCYGLNAIYLAAKDPELTGGITKSLCKLYSPERGKLENTIIYMQNINDDFHYIKHYKEFAQSVGVEPLKDVGFCQQGRFLTIVGDWGSGHAPAPRVLWATILKNIFLHAENFDELINHGEGEKLIAS